jgi:hypothetical protein
MPAELPNLSGIATKDLVETIGSGSFKASYINWSRTMELLRKNAPGWMAETVFNAEGELLHKAPVGAYLLIRFRHVDGTVTSEVPQAVMDHRNNAIPFDKITARDITDTQRRGACLAAAMTFGLAYELWAKMPLESGYQVADEEVSEKARPAAKKESKTASVKEPTPEVYSDSEKTEFVTLATSMGLCDPAIEELMAKIKGDFSTGIKTLASKDKEFVSKMNEKFLASQY